MGKEADTGIYLQSVKCQENLMQQHKPPLTLLPLLGSNPLDLQANLLNGTWILKDQSSAVKDGSVVSDFKDLTLTFSNGNKDGGSYATTNSIDADVWSNSGTWQFQNGDRSKLLRSH